MAYQPTTRASITLIFIVMLIGAALIALIAAFLPSIVGFDDEATTIMRVVLGAAAMVSVGQAFWLKAKLTKQLSPEERKAGGSVQRQ